MSENPIGIDLSHWRTVLSFPMMAAAGVEFVYTKATEGVVYQDPTFLRYWEGIQSAGMLRGAFHYYLPWQNAEQQALSFYQAVSGAGTAGMLPPAADFEEDNANPKHFKEFLDTCENLFDIRPLIYTSVRYWFRIAPSWTADYLLWVASWYRSTPTLPRGWTTWAIHQYTNRGHGPTYGVKELTLDMNRFNGTSEQLQELATAPNPNPEPTIQLARPRAALNIRDKPWGAVIGEAEPGSTWQIERVSFDGVGRPWFWINPRACFAGWLTNVANL